MQIFVTDVPAYKAALRELGPVWQRHFGRRYPATGLFGVTRLFDDEALIELMALAVLAEDRDDRRRRDVDPLLDAHLQPDQLELLETTTAAARERWRRWRTRAPRAR